MSLKFTSTLICVVLAFAASFMIALLAGENPFTVCSILINGAFGTPTNIGYTLYYSTPLVFTGLSVAWALRAGLFNIGAEGQMALAGVALAALGVFDLPTYVAIPCA